METNSFSVLCYIRNSILDQQGKASLFLRITVNTKRAEFSIKRKVKLVSIFWLWYYGDMVYYHFYFGSGSPYHFRPPFWVSIMNAIFACLGIVIGLRLFKNKMLIKEVIFGILLDNFGYKLFL